MWLLLWLLLPLLQHAELNRPLKLFLLPLSCCLPLAAAAGIIAAAATLLLLLPLLGCLAKSHKPLILQPVAAAGAISSICRLRSRRPQLLRCRGARGGRPDQLHWRALAFLCRPLLQRRPACRACCCLCWLQARVWLVVQQAGCQRLLQLLVLVSQRAASGEEM